MSTPLFSHSQRFGEKLRALRVQQGMTLKGLAAALGLRAHGYLSELESGKKAPTASLVVGIAHLFHTTTDQLLRDELNPTYRIAQERKDSGLSVIFADRPPTPQEIERLRLLLSTYQDGTGMLVTKRGTTLPGWRDFERAVALAFSGTGSENKAIFDVLLKDAARAGTYCGLSCKMRGELRRIARDGRVTVELSNAASQFWDELATKDITDANYQDDPQTVGITLIELVRRWHQDASIERRGSVDLDKSFYLVLSWSPTGLYQLHLFSLSLPDPKQLRWHTPTKQVKGQAKGVLQVSRRVIGNDDGGDGIRVVWDVRRAVKILPSRQFSIMAVRAVSS